MGWLCWKACDAFVSLAFTVFTFFAFSGRIFLVSIGNFLMTIFERSLSLPRLPSARFLGCMVSILLLLIGDGENPTD